MSIRNVLQNIIGIFSKIKSGFSSIKSLTKHLPQHTFRVLSIEEDAEEGYIAVIQLTNKNTIFRMRPEEILANDSITDGFSQRDIRTLTYLGYLGINSPKYKILAERLSGKDSKLIFAIHERGKKEPIIKTANEIALDENLINGLNQKDAHRVGYAVATEQVIEEVKQKEQLLKILSKDGQV